ncbi:MAG: GntR family transcriptional regulator [Micromonosporaceae bacterium]|nr:GntR family transcriptional regulator [Micromonosporaceae bacterium]
MPAGTVGETPLYQVVADALRARIRSGDLRPGDRLPTEHELMAEYGVSRNTVRLALNLLTAEGLITGGRGRAGRVVRLRELITIHVAHHDEPGRGAGNEDSPFIEAVHGHGFRPSQEIEVAVRRAPDGIAEKLGLAKDALVVLRSRLRLLNGDACSIADSYYPYELVKDTPIMEPYDIKRGAIGLLAERGWVQNRYVDEVSTRMPSPDEARRLGLSPGIPVLFQIRTGYVDDKPIRVTRTMLRGDRHRLVYELPS